MSVVVVAILTVRDDDAFREFETRAAEVMAAHGAAIERVVSVPGTPRREVHVVRFPSDTAYAAYRADPALAAMADLRARGIAATEVLIGDGA